MHECHVDVTPSRFLMSALLDPLLPAKRLLLAALAASVIACSGRGQYAAVASAAGATAGVDPELYGAGLFSTGFWDYFMAWSPDQRDVLFCRATDDFSSFEIFATRLGKDGHWTAPRHPEFAALEQLRSTHHDGWKARLLHLEPATPDRHRQVGPSDLRYLVLGPAEQRRVGRGAPSRRADERPGRQRVVAGRCHERQSVLRQQPAGGRTRGPGSLAVAVRRRRVSAAREPGGVHQHQRSRDRAVDRADESYLKHARYRGAVGPRFDWPPNDEHIRNIGNGKSGDMYRVPMTAVRTTPR